MHTNLQSVLRTISTFLLFLTIGGFNTLSAQSTDATLSGLSISSGTLAPGFAPGTLSYNVTVTNATTSLTVTPVTNVNTATVNVNGTSVASGTPSGPNTLNIGHNLINVVVTAQDGVTIITYSIDVLRPGNVATLSNLAISAGTLTPVFSSGTLSYTASVNNATSSITLTPTTTDANATITVNGSSVVSGSPSSSLALAVGANTFSIIVTAQNGITTKSYSVKVTRALSAVSSLSNLAISSGTLTPVFASGTLSYTATVANIVTSITFTPTTTDNNATVKVNGVVVASGAASGSIALHVGTNTITTVVTAQDNISKTTYTTVITRIASAISTLSNLTINTGTLTPIFASGTTSYTVSVGNLITSMKITPTVTDNTAKVKVNGVTVASGSASGSIALVVGNNTITTVVTAQDGTTTSTYTVVVTRAPSAVATLSHLSISSGTLAPVFATGTTTYTVSVSSSLAGIKVTPTTTDHTATIKVNGATVASGSASALLPLVLGNNIITTVVTAQDGTTTDTYTITVFKPSGVSSLSDLALSSGTLTPVFASGTKSYTASVGNLVTSLTVTPTTTDNTSTVKVNGTTVASGSASGAIALNVGVNTITTIVTAQDGVTTTTYTTKVTRAPSAVASLSNLALNGGTLAPVFASGTLSYTASVGNLVTSLMVIPITTDNTATVKVNGVTVASGAASGPIALNVGNNTIKTVVTAQDHTTIITYTTVVTRAPSAVATLSNLALSAGTLDAVFASGTNSYTASVGNLITSIKVTPTVTDHTAKVKVNGVAVASGSASGSIPLVVGINTITTIVTAQDGTTTDTYTIVVTRAPSAVATLSHLSISTGTLSPVFATGTTSYTASVSSATASIKVTPTVTDHTATIAVNGTPVVSGTASPSIALSVGNNTITIIVTAQDGTTTDTYTITVLRPSAVSTLSDLAISSGTLTPVFASGTLSYTATVANAASTITMTPTTTESHATVKVNGVLVASGAPSGAIALHVGTNTITTVVTAQDNVTKTTYTTVVTRVPSAVSTLSNIALSAGTLAPIFDAGTTSYTVSVGNLITSMKITPTVTDNTAKVKVNGVTVASGSASGSIALVVGNNTITTVVTAQDGTTTSTYTVVVTRAPSAVATLSHLSISSGTLAPVFATGTTTYTVSVSSSLAGIKVTPTTTDHTATIKVNGATVASGSASALLPLVLGNNIITTVVTAQDGTTTDTYTITVFKPSGVSSLSDLALSSGTLTPVFASGTKSYTASVGNLVTSLTVTPTTTDNTSTVKVNGTTVASGSASGAIALNVGVNTITTIVTAQDGVTTTTYTTKVTRAPSAVASLSNLALNGGTLAPVFASGTLSYTASVGNLVTSLTVTPTTTDNTATVKVNGVTVASGSASGPIALNVGNNTIKTVVTAQDHTTIITYTTVVTRAPSAVATLSNLALSAGTLAPVFASGTNSYTASVGNLITSIKVTPTVTDHTAKVKVNGVAVASGSASGSIPLVVGINTITTIVTAQDGTTTDTYTTSVTRAPSAVATLSHLSISSGTLAPVFATGTTSYTASVSSATASIKVTPTVTDHTATIAVNGTPVVSGTASPSIALSVGNNTITIIVTAQDGTTTDTYTVVVTRAASNVSSLSHLSISSGSFTPSFASATTSYNVSVSNNTTSVKVTPTTVSNLATVKVNGNYVVSGSASSDISLNVGSKNTITITVTAQDGITVTNYTINVTRAASSENTLSNLTISSGILSPTFASGTTSYSVSLANGVNSVTVTPIATDNTSTIKVNGALVYSGNSSDPIPLNIGANTITIIVTAQNGVATKTYTISLSRAATSALRFVDEPSVSKAAIAVLPEDHNIILYPNPVVNNKLNIKLNNQKAGRYKIMIYDTRGVQVHSEVINYNGGSNNYEIHLNYHIAQGIFQVMILTPDNKVEQKRIVLSPEK